MKTLSIRFLFLLLSLTHIGLAEGQPLTGVVASSYRVTSVTYTTEYQAILDRATALGYAQPSAAQKLRQDSLVMVLKSDGTWALLDVFYMFENNGSKEFGTLNWITPTANQLTLVGSPTWTSNVGFTSNGTSSYLNTNFNPSTQGVQYTKNSACWFIQESDDVASNDLNGAIDGSSNGVFIRMKSATGTSLFRINDATNSANLTNTSSIGLLSAVRTTSAARALYRNASSLGSDSQASTAVPSLNLYIGAWNNNGTAAFVSGARTFNSAGAGAGSIDQTKLYNAVHKFTANP